MNETDEVSPSKGRVYLILIRRNDRTIEITQLWSCITVDAWPARETVLDTFNDYVTLDYLHEQTLFAKVTITGGETVRIGAWHLSGSTGAPIDTLALFNRAGYSNF